MTVPTVSTWLERGTCLWYSSFSIYIDIGSDGNIRYYEYENDKFEYLSEHKSADPQRGIAFLPRRGINVSVSSGSIVSGGGQQAHGTRFTRMRS
jgi:hypothetical protein